MYSSFETMYKSWRKSLRDNVFFNDTKQIKETVTILSTRFLPNNICITCCALLFSFISLIKVFNVKNLCNNAYSLIPTLRSSGNIMPKVTMGNGGRCMIALLKLELFQSDRKKRHKTAYSCFLLSSCRNNLNVCKEENRLMLLNNVN